MLCPCDCRICRNAECREGCRLSGEPVLEVCYLCGEIVTPLSRIVLCMRCADDEPPAERRQRAAAR